MSKANAFILLIGDWWSKAVALVGVAATLLGLWKGLKAIRADKLALAHKEIKSLRADVARLLREATVRIDNEQKYIEEVDGYQRKIIEQREQISELINANSSKQNSQSSNR
jgi:hypothetical protein